MPTLKEFVVNVLTENHLPGDPDEIIKKITEVARERAVQCGSGQVAFIDPEEVREMVINNAELTARIAQERAEKRAREEKEKQAKEAEAKAKKDAEKLKKSLEKEKHVSNGEQTSLFGWPSL